MKLHTRTKSACTSPNENSGVASRSEAGVAGRLLRKLENMPRPHELAAFGCSSSCCGGGFCAGGGWDDGNGTPIKMANIRCEAPTKPKNVVFDHCIASCRLVVAILAA